MREVFIYLFLTALLLSTINGQDRVTQDLIEVINKHFKPAQITIEQGDSIEFYVLPLGDLSRSSSFASTYENNIKVDAKSDNKYVICVEDINESDLISKVQWGQLVKDSGLRIILFVLLIDSGSAGVDDE